MLPFMRYKNSTRQHSITTFGGINNSYSQMTNEFSEALNMSSRSYPAVSSHKGMTSYSTPQNILCAAGYFDKLYTIEKTESAPGEMYICTSNTRTYLSRFESEEDGQRDRIVEFMKDCALVIPDNVVCYTNSMKTESACVSQKITQDTEQERFESLSDSTNSMPSQYSSWYCAELSSNKITALAATYKASGASHTFYSFAVSNSFEVGDIVTLKMNVKVVDVVENTEVRAYKQKMAEGITLKIKGFNSSYHSSAWGYIEERTAIIFDDNTIDLGGFDDVVVVDMVIEKGMPNFVDICAFENRMWGVTESQICASKLGDCTIWEDFTADSYGTLPSSCFKTEVESGGDFTAICALSGNILAFKEDCIHKIYGSEPAEFHISRINCPGVEKGALKTLAAVGGVLYYKGKGGIYAYNGSSVRLVTHTFDISSYTADLAAGDDRFYCIHLFNETENLIAVYDTVYDIWHKTTCEGTLKALVRTDVGVIAGFENSIMKFAEGSCGQWSFCLNFGKKEFASKHICSVFARCSLKDGGKAKISIRNKHGTYELKTIEKAMCDFPVMVTIPVSCARDAVLLFEGEGEFTLSSLTVRYKETGIND